MTQAVGVGEEQDQGLEQAEAELPRVLHQDARPANRATAVQVAELTGHDQEVVTLLRLANLLHGGPLGGGLAQVTLRQLALALEVVHGVPAVHLAHLAERLLAGIGVGLAELTPVDEDEVPLGALRERLAGEPIIVEGASELGEELLQAVRLLEKGPWLTVPREVAVARGDFLAREVLPDTVLGDELRDHVVETGGLVDALRFVLTETRLVIGGLGDGHELATLRIAMTDRRGQL